MTDRQEVRSNHLHQVPSEIGVPWNNSLFQYQEIKDEVDAAINRVFQEGKSIYNSDVFAFEEEFSAYCGVSYGVAVHSGSDAIALALLALGIQEGDAVVLPDNSCLSEPNAIMMSGGIPVPVDIDGDTYNIDPAKIATSIGPNTRAIHAVHAYGQPCDIESIKQIAQKHSLPVIEDISLAPGARINGKRVGSFGDLGVVSFGQGKILNAYGNGGGMVLTDSKSLAKKVRNLANYGQGKISGEQRIDDDFLPCDQQVWVELGYNSMLDAIQAAVLRVKLQHLDEWLKKREERAEYYRECLASLDVILPCVSNTVTSSYRGYVIRVKERRNVLKHLIDYGVEVRLLYLPPVHLQPAMSKYEYQEGDFPVTERVARELIVLPIYPELENKKIEYVAQVLSDALQLPEQTMT